LAGFAEKCHGLKPEAKKFTLKGGKTLEHQFENILDFTAIMIKNSSYFNERQFLVRYSHHLLNMHYT